MTIEEKAKAYDEALEKVKPLYERAKKDDSPIWATYEHLFPQLTESEDERIRKELLEVIRHCYEDGGYTLCTDDYKKYSAYLEKQKEQKPIQTEDEKEYIRTIKSLITDFIRDKKPEDIAHYQGIYDWLDGMYIEQKQTERQDYSGLNDLEGAIHRGFLSAGVENVPVKIIKETAQECLAQMKPAEWSEEDEIRKESCMLYLANTRDVIEFSQHIGDNARKSGKNEIQKDIDWLKSLRPSWKPTKEQMQYLLAVINDPNNIGAESCYLTLKSLYDDLKKFQP